jgi:hypothetical protein
MEISNAINLWINHFRTTLFQGASEQEIAKLMAPIARDNAWMYHGGSGNRSRFYMIDDYLRVRFDFDRRDLLLSYTVYESKEGWLKGPDGVLLNGDSAVGELQFPALAP